MNYNIKITCTKVLIAPYLNVDYIVINVIKT